MAGGITKNKRQNVMTKNNSVVALHASHTAAESASRNCNEPVSIIEILTRNHRPSVALIFVITSGLNVSPFPAKEPSL
jgi:hypothetical protein